MTRYAVRIRKTSFTFGGVLYLGRDGAVESPNEALYWRERREAEVMAALYTKRLRLLDVDRPACTVVRLTGTFGNWSEDNGNVSA